MIERARSREFVLRSEAFPDAVGAGRAGEPAAHWTEIALDEAFAHDERLRCPTAHRARENGMKERARAAHTGRVAHGAPVEVSDPDGDGDLARVTDG